MANGRKTGGRDFKKGEGGRPKGSRNKLTEDFLSVLYDDFTEHGKDALTAMRQGKPSEYIKAIVQLVPKEHKINIVEEIKTMSDEELIAKLQALDEQLGRSEPASTEIHPHSATH